VPSRSRDESDELDEDQVRIDREVHDFVEILDLTLAGQHEEPVAQEGALGDLDLSLGGRGR
jgi:hypothetical protein